MRYSQLILLALLALTLTGCSLPREPAPFVESRGSTDAPLTGTVEMTAQNFQFHPNHLVVKAGTTIHLNNLDDAGQSLLTDDKTIDSGVLGQGESTELQFDELGTLRFSSEPFPNMTGTITVVP